MNYIEAQPEGVVSTIDRRCRDRKPFDPKRRTSDDKIQHSYVNERELELLDLIDGHIARLSEKQEPILTEDELFARNCVRAEEIANQLKPRQWERTD